MMKINSLIKAGAGLMVALFAMPAMAIPNPIPEASQLPEFTEFNKAIEVPSYDNRIIYRYNPATPGVMTVYSKSPSEDLDLFLSKSYNSEAYTVGIEQYDGERIDNPTNGYTYGYAYNLTPDRQYYISIPQTNFNKTTEVMFTWEETEVEATGVASVFPAPAVDEYFNYNTYQDVQVRGTSPVSSFGKVTFSYLDQNIELSDIDYVGLQGNAENQFLQINVAKLGLINYIAQAAEAGAQEVTITISDLFVNGVKVTENATGNDNITVNEGTVTITYPVTQAPKYLADVSVWPSTFYSYWEAGDPRAVAILVFDQPIQSAGEVNVVMGPVSPGVETGENEYETYNVTPVVDYNTLTLNFAGVKYKGSTSKVTVMVQNVVGENGLPAAMDGYSIALYQQIDYKSSDAPAISYMGEATQLNYSINTSELYPTVEVTWKQNVTLLNEDEVSIPVKKDGEEVGKLSATYLNLVPQGENTPGIATRANSGEKGYTLYFLIGTAGFVTGEGTYSIDLPAGLFMSESGELNPAQTFTVDCLGMVQGVISPEAGTFYSDQDVVITITFEGKVEQNDSKDAPLIITDYADFDESYGWDDGILTIEGSKVIINLGKTLSPGTYELNFREGQVLVDGIANAPLSYTFTVSPDAGIEDLIDNATGEVKIYNLNGVKVDGRLQPGIYIVNGKKVVVR